MSKTITIGAKTYEDFINEPHKTTFVDTDVVDPSNRTLYLSRSLPNSPSGTAKSRLKLQQDVVIGAGLTVRSDRAYFTVDLSLPADMAKADKEAFVDDCNAFFSDPLSRACLIRNLV